MVFCLCAAWTKDYWRRPRHVLDDNPLPAPVRREAPGRVLPVDAGGAELKAPRPHGGDAAALASLPPLLGCGALRSAFPAATAKTRPRPPLLRSLRRERDHQVPSFDPALPLALSLP